MQQKLIQAGIPFTDSKLRHQVFLVIKQAARYEASQAGLDFLKLSPNLRGNHFLTVSSTGTGRLFLLVLRCFDDVGVSTTSGVEFSLASCFSFLIFTAGGAEFVKKATLAFLFTALVLGGGVTDPVRGVLLPDGFTSGVVCLLVSLVTDFGVLNSLDDETDGLFCDCFICGTFKSTFWDGLFEKASDTAEAIWSSKGGEGVPLPVSDSLVEVCGTELEVDATELSIFVFFGIS